jgi:plasmid stabilization system protein ParE
VTIEIRFLDEAIAELDHAAGWYQSQRDGLGLTFLAAVDRAVDSIERWPRTGPLVDQVPDHLEVRRAPIVRFPYHLAYMITDDVLFVLAIAHEHRRPGYWSERTDS